MGQEELQPHTDVGVPSSRPLTRAACRTPRLRRSPGPLDTTQDRHRDRESRDAAAYACRRRALRDDVGLDHVRAPLRAALQTRNE